MDPRAAAHAHLRVEAGVVVGSRDDFLAVEEPLEIRLHGQPMTVTMRTPGDDRDLAAGLLLTEGLIHRCQEIGTIRHCPTDERNVVDVTLTVPFDLARLQRTFLSNSSCGVCGKKSIDQIRTQAPPLSAGFQVGLQTILGLGDSLRRGQTVFEKTGGLHAAGIFDGSGSLLVLREDIGRHNAVDKSIGSLFLENRLPLDRHILMVSGRASFEILQKALMASISVVCAVSAPSSLAVEFARECGMTLIGFLRGREFNLYSGKERIILE